MGVEYIVSKKLYDTLPAEEKELWHRHVYEGKSGMLIAPGMPQVAEHKFMEIIAGTYGKTWHTWHTDQQRTLPTGHPLLMMGFTADGRSISSSSPIVTSALIFLPKRKSKSAPISKRHLSTPRPTLGKRETFSS
jgi:hypothetical protein